MSIESDLYRYVSGDTTLQALLSATAGTSKVYWSPIAPEGAVSPHVCLYRVGEGSPDELTDHIRITARITAPSLGVALASTIRDRLNDLLDFKKTLRRISIPSADYFISHSEKNGGQDDVDETTKEAIKVINYDISFHHLT